MRATTAYPDCGQVPFILPILLIFIIRPTLLCLCRWRVIVDVGSNAGHPDVGEVLFLCSPVAYSSACSGAFAGRESNAATALLKYGVLSKALDLQPMCCDLHLCLTPLRAIHVHFNIAYRTHTCASVPNPICFSRHNMFVTTFFKGQRVATRPHPPPHRHRHSMKLVLRFGPHTSMLKCMAASMKGCDSSAVMVEPIVFLCLRHGSVTTHYNYVTSCLQECLDSVSHHIALSSCSTHSSVIIIVALVFRLLSCSLPC